MLPPGATEHTPGARVGNGAAQPTIAIEEEAYGLGFCAIRITTADALEEDGQQLREWLRSGHQGSMHYLAARGRDEPSRLLQCVRSIVTVALPYVSPRETSSRWPEQPRGRLASYAIGADYHIVLKERLRQLADRLAGRLGRPVIARPCVDTAPVLERALAARSGLGFVGKNTMLIVPGVGSTVILGELLLDLELPRSEPIRKRCGQCTACLDVCPTGAFVAPYVLDARRCISYLTIEHRGVVPRELRAKIGDRIFGCDLCQDVCPWNMGTQAARERVTASEPREDTAAGRGAGRQGSIALTALLRQRSGDYKRLVKGTALSRASREQLARNAAIALGNSGSPAAVAPLCQALAGHSSALVRGHAAWALGELGLLEGRAALEFALVHDTDPAVREECRESLARLRNSGSKCAEPNAGSVPINDK